MIAAVCMINADCMINAGWGSVAVVDRAESVELRLEVLVATVDQPDTAHPGGALGCERGDEVAEPAAQVGHRDVGAVQLGGPRHDGRVLEVALPEAAREAAEALAVELDLRPHLAQRPGEAE